MNEKSITGAVILATGANEYQPKEFLYGTDERVVTQVELANRLQEEGGADYNQVVMIQCVGSRNEGNPNCSRICCQSAIKNALHIKEMNPDTDIYILYRDIRMYGFLEEYYTEARKKGIMFFRYNPEDTPVVESTAEGVAVTFTDHILGRKLMVSADLLALSAGMVPEDTEELSSIMKLARNEDGFFMEAHVKLRPVDMATEGIFCLRDGSQPQAGDGNHFPGLCGSLSGIDIFIPGSDHPFSRNGPCKPGKMCLLPYLCSVMCLWRSQD